MVAAEGGMAGPEGHPLLSTSCELNLLLLSAGGIRDVPLWGQKAALEIRWAHPSVLTQLLWLWIANQATESI